MPRSTPTTDAWCAAPSSFMTATEAAPSTTWAAVSTRSSPTRNAEPTPVPSQVVAWTMVTPLATWS
nr:hypothetical protein [Phytoactinopolyspora halotolerans]